MTLPPISSEAFCELADEACPGLRCCELAILLALRGDGMGFVGLDQPLAETVRQTFSAEELAVVLSHFDLGIVESITEFARGSRANPKVGLVCERGKFLLKRRSISKNDSRHVSFSHELQSHLAEHGFPLPRLIPNRLGETALRWRDYLYELFDFIAGHPFSRSVAETGEAGRTLALFHDLARTLSPRNEVRTVDYHDNLGVRTGLNAIPAAIMDHECTAVRRDELPAVVNGLFDAYEEAAADAIRRGFSDFPPHIIHSDWHPGNMLFKRDALVAVIDYDAARLSRRVLDVANGALQFSMLGGQNPEEWPDHLDEVHLSAFLDAYRPVQPLSVEEQRCLVPLMIEAVVAECVPPILATGYFGPWPGSAFLGMVRRKVQWLKKESARLEARWIEQSASDEAATPRVMARPIAL